MVADRIRRGRFVPILGGWLDFELAVGVSEEQLTNGYSEFVQYSLPGPYRLAPLIDYRRIMQHDRRGADGEFLHFVKNLIFETAVRDGLYRDTLDEVEAQAEQVNVTQFANLLGYPRFGKGAEDPLQVLANLPFKTILTTSPFTFIEDGLRRAGKKPHTELCRWRKDLRDLFPLPSTTATSPANENRWSTTYGAWIATLTPWCWVRTTTWAMSWKLRRTRKPFIPQCGSPSPVPRCCCLGMTWMICAGKSLIMRAS